MNGTLNTIPVRITATDIRRGQRYSQRSCALALALRRIFGTWAQIDDDTWESPMGGGELPDVAKRFREDFDQCKRDVGPMNFDLPVPWEVLRPDLPGQLVMFVSVPEFPAQGVTTHA